MVLFKIDYLGNANVSFVGADASKLIFELDNMGICVSSGSACSSGNTTPSHVLSAINTPKLYINSAIRSTFSDFNTFEEVDYFINALKLIDTYSDIFNPKLELIVFNANCSFPYA